MLKPLPELYDVFARVGQAHVFAYWDTLSQVDQIRFLEQLKTVDLTLLGRLVEGLSTSNAVLVDLETKAPAVMRHPEHGGDATRWALAFETGEQALREGRVAALTVAGGQGTRLGHLGPKGTFCVTPLTKKSLFQVFAEKLLAARRRYNQEIPWFIMTSPVNHVETVAFFKAHHYFGLGENTVYCFTQGLMPVVDFQGKLLMETPSSLALAPDGHGGIFPALLKSGALARMASLGIEVMSYFQVDNPLVPVIDPFFIGFHLIEASDISSKTVYKNAASEKVGLFVERSGQVGVLEYSDAPLALLERRGMDGALVFSAANIAVHAISHSFAAKMAGAALPYHQAKKKVKSLDATGKVIEPSVPNGIKFETFIFDALPLASHALLLEVLREDEFSPVKNATGVDSPESARSDQAAVWCRWFNAEGVTVPKDLNLEISPLWADSLATFKARYAALIEKPMLHDGLILE